MGEFLPGLKDFLKNQLAAAYDGRPDMSLLAVLKDVTQAEADWRPDASVPTIEQIVRHIAWSKMRFCQMGFGTPMAIEDRDVNDDGDHADLPLEFPCGAAWGLKEYPGIAGAKSLLEKAQKNFTDCLMKLSEEDLDKPIKSPHGKTAANFFSVMSVHDFYHAGQIRTRRTVMGKMKT